MRFSAGRICGRASAIALAAIASAVALGQQSGGGPIALEEIVVTAQKRTERLQDVPISVSAESGADLERAQVDSVLDLSDRFANVSLPDTGAKGQNILLRIRGLGNNNATSTLRAGIIVDEVPYLSPRGLNAGVFDVERVQVLRGPQSTLYGLTAEAGLIIIDSVKPTLDRWDGKLSLQYGSEGEYLASGRVSAPLIQNRLAIGVSATAGGGDGWLDSVVTGDGYNESENWAARVQLVAAPNDDLSIRAVVAREKVDDSYGLALLPQDRAQYNTQYGVSTGEFESAQNYAGYTRNTDDTAALTVRWDLGGAELVSVSAYRDFETLPSFDIDQGPLPTFLGPFSVLSGQPEAELQTVSQELRLQSDDDRTLTWTVGAFYYTRDETTRATATVIAPIQTVLTVGPEEESEFESYSAFGQAAYAFASGWTLTGGVRYEDAKEDTRQVVSGVAASTADDIVLPKVTLSYAPVDRFMVYASAGRGWLAGGVDTSGPTAKPEKSWSYELGTKTTWFDDRLRFNFDIYQTTVDDYQESIRTGLITQATANAGEVRFQGVDLEVEAAVTEALVLALSYGYTDAEYRDFVEFDPATGGVINRAGFRVPGVADFDLNFSATYRSQAGFFAAAELNASGDLLETKDTRNVLPEIDGYSIVNLRAGLERDRWSLMAFCNNVADKEYFVYGNDQLGNGQVFLAPGRSRYYGLRAEYRFGTGP